MTASENSWCVQCSDCALPLESPDSGFCPACRARVEVLYPTAPTSRLSPAGREPGMWRYRARLPIGPDDPVISMGEGGTPLVPSTRIGPSLGLDRLHFKLETCNPTGSFKDRLAALLVSRLKARGAQTLLGITSGNAGSAVAAYATRAGIRSIILYLAGAPPSKRLQMHAYGANVILLRGAQRASQNLTRVFQDMVELGRSQGWGVTVASHAFDPISVEAYKTIAFEISRQLEADPPDYLYSPAGEGALLAACWKGFKECQFKEARPRLPRMVAAQPAGACSIAEAYRQGRPEPVAVEPRSNISGVTSACSSDGALALEAINQSQGHCCCPTDQETHQAQVRLAREEGIFAEPAGAIALAALVKDVKGGRINSGRSAVCLITASGFKDREAADRLFFQEGPPSLPFDQLDRIPALVAGWP